MPATQEVNRSTIPQVLYLAFDLGLEKWSLAFSVGLGSSPRTKAIPAGSLWRLKQEIAGAKRKLGLPEDAPVCSCYEAGRDGFWLHRSLIAQGVENVVVDSSSIEVNRRQRRVKTDRLDSTKLVNLLIRLHLGDAKVFSQVHVPTPEEEADRHLHRSLKTWKEDETMYINRIRGVLANIGVFVEPDKHFPERLKNARQWDGQPVPAELRDRVLGDFAVLQATRQQIKQAAARQRQALRKDERHSTQQARKLLSLHGVGFSSAWTLSKEFFWRTFDNRRQVGSLAGLTPTHHSSGSLHHDRGISRAGNRWVRGIIVELAWCWLQHQPKSKLSLWYQKRFAHGNTRLRKVGIVAVARKLLTALWQYLETGVPPEGAVMVDWRAKMLKRKRVVCEVVA
jgi:transposase